MVVNILDYGASPELADNTEPFCRAAREAGATSRGGVIVVPIGDYRIAGTIRTPTNCAATRFEGVTHQGSRLLHTGAGPLLDLTWAYRGSGLSRLGLVGGPATSHLLYLGASSENDFEELWLDG